MDGETRREDLNFKVERFWCGGLIRRYAARDAHGMCLSCYARMLGEHGHSHESGDRLRWAGDHVSER